MSLFSVETRELRSFRIRYRIEELRSVIKNKKTDGAFCLANSLHPIEREDLRSDLNKNNISITSLSKNIIRFVFDGAEKESKQKWKNVRSLLEGQIFLIQNKDESTGFNKNFLTNLTKSDKFTLRLFLHNHQIYRKHQVARLVATPEQNKPAILVLLLLKQILIQQNIYLHTKYTKSNKN